MFKKLRQALDDALSSLEEGLRQERGEEVEAPRVVVEAMGEQDRLRARVAPLADVKVQAERAHEAGARGRDRAGVVDFAGGHGPARIARTRRAAGDPLLRDGPGARALKKLPPRGGKGPPEVCRRRRKPRGSLG